MIEVTNKEEFERETKSQGLVVVDFWATWCAPCKALAKTLEKLSKELEGVKFVKAEITAVPEVAGKYMVSTVPTLIFFRDGQVLKQVTGSMTHAKLSSLISGL